MIATMAPMVAPLATPLRRAMAPHGNHKLICQEFPCAPTPCQPLSREVSLHPLIQTAPHLDPLSPSGHKLTPLYPQISTKAPRSHNSTPHPAHVLQPQKRSHECIHTMTGALRLPPCMFIQVVHPAPAAPAPLGAQQTLRHLQYHQRLPTPHFKHHGCSKVGGSVFNTTLCFRTKVLKGGHRAVLIQPWVLVVAVHHLVWRRVLRNLHPRYANLADSCYVIKLSDKVSACPFICYFLSPHIGTVLCSCFC